MDQEENGTINVGVHVEGYSKLHTQYIGEWGWSGGTMVLGKLPVPGRPTIWTIVGQGPIALTWVG